MTPVPCDVCERGRLRCMSEKLDAKTARVMIWEQLRKFAKPDSRFSWNFSEFITDYEGSESCARLLVSQDIYKNSGIIFVTPDNNLEHLREQIIRDKKTLLMTNYGIRRGVFAVCPGDVPDGKEELASTLDGVQRFWKFKSLAQVESEFGHIDLLVTGASAITPSGIRFGKGHGYFDLEWAMFHTIGVVNAATPVVAVGHDCQVMDVDVEVRPFDTAIDYIVTTTQVIKTRNEFPKPSEGVLWSLLEKGMLEDILPLQELWARIACK